MKDQSTQPGFFTAFFGFKRMVSPFFLTLVYFLGLLGIITGTVLAVMHAPQMIQMQTGVQLEILPMVGAYIGIVLGGLLLILGWRFGCELLIVLFGIFNRLTQIKCLLQEPVNAAVTAARVQSTIAPVPVPLPDDLVPRIVEEAVMDPSDTETDALVVTTEPVADTPSLEEILAEGHTEETPEEIEVAEVELDTPVAKQSDSDEEGEPLPIPTKDEIMGSKPILMGSRNGVEVDNDDVVTTNEEPVSDETGDSDEST